MTQTLPLFVLMLMLLVLICCNCKPLPEGEDTEKAVVEDSSSFATKEVLGYMWPLPLLKKHEKPIPKRLQSITHQGKIVKGASLSEWVLGHLSLLSSCCFY